MPSEIDRDAAWMDRGFLAEARKSYPPRRASSPCEAEDPATRGIAFARRAADVPASAPASAPPPPAVAPELLTRSRPGIDSWGEVQGWSPAFRVQQWHEGKRGYGRRIVRDAWPAAPEHVDLLSAATYRAAPASAAPRQIPGAASASAALPGAGLRLPVPTAPAPRPRRFVPAA